MERSVNQKDIWCVLGVMVDDQWCEGCFMYYDEAIKHLDKIEERNKKENNMVTKVNEKELHIEGVDVTFYIEKTKLYQ